MIFEDYENLLAGHDIIKDKTYLSQQLNKVLCEYTHNHLRSKVLKTRSDHRPGLGRYGLRQRSRPLPRRRWLYNLPAGRATAPLEYGAGGDLPPLSALLLP